MSTSPEQVPQPSAWGPWRKVRGITPGWAGACLLAWGCAVLVAAVTVPLKYPYEAAGTVVDSAAVMGLLGFVAVVGLSLREGPRHLVRGAALRLWPSRLALAASCTALVGAASWGLAILAGLPRGLVILDALLYLGLVLVSTSFFGATFGWVPPLALALVMSAPSLVPWRWNLLYNQDRTVELFVTVTVVLTAGLALYAWRGSDERFRVEDDD